MEKFMKPLPMMKIKQKYSNKLRNFNESLLERTSA